MMKISALSLLLLSLSAYPQMPEMVAKIEDIHSLRESLVGQVQGPVTSETFQAVCKPVGAKLLELANSTGWSVRQASHKYRNPKHKTKLAEQKALQKFLKNPELVSYFEQSEKGLQYYRRITVRAACLNCHGPKNQRPEFVVTGYPKDQAYDFKEGDLRGLYSVFAPHNK